MNLEDEMYRVMAALSAGDVPVDFRKRKGSRSCLWYPNESRLFYAINGRSHQL